MGEHAALLFADDECRYRRNAAAARPQLAQTSLITPQCKE
jgi:hypothetical protein